MSNTIKFKNGSVITCIDTKTDNIRSNRANNIIFGKPTLRSRWLDFMLKLKSLFR